MLRWDDEAEILDVDDVNFCIRMWPHMRSPRISRTLHLVPVVPTQELRISNMGFVIGEHVCTNQRNVKWKASKEQLGEKASLSSLSQPTFNDDSAKVSTGFRSHIPAA